MERKRRDALSNSSPVRENIYSASGPQTAEMMTSPRSMNRRPSISTNPSRQRRQSIGVPTFMPSSFEPHESHESTEADSIPSIDENIAEEPFQWSHLLKPSRKPAKKDGDADSDEYEAPPQNLPKSRKFSILGWASNLIKAKEESHRRRRSSVNNAPRGSHEIVSGFVGPSNTSSVRRRSVSTNGEVSRLSMGRRPSPDANNISAIVGKFRRQSNSVTASSSPERKDRQDIEPIIKASEGLEEIKSDDVDEQWELIDEPRVPAVTSSTAERQPKTYTESIKQSIDGISTNPNSSYPDIEAAFQQCTAEPRPSIDDSVVEYANVTAPNTSMDLTETENIYSYITTAPNASVILNSTQASSPSPEPSANGSSISIPDGPMTSTFSINGVTKGLVTIKSSIRSNSRSRETSSDRESAHVNPSRASLISAPSSRASYHGAGPSLSSLQPSTDNLHTGPKTSMKSIDLVGSPEYSNPRPSTKSSDGSTPHSSGPRPSAASSRFVSSELHPGKNNQLNVSNVSLDTWSIDDLTNPDVKEQNPTKFLHLKAQHQVIPPGPMNNIQVRNVEVQLNTAPILVGVETLQEKEHPAPVPINNQPVIDETLQQNAETTMPDHQEQYSHYISFKSGRRRSSPLSNIGSAMKRFMGSEPKSKLVHGQIRVISESSLFDDKFKSDFGLKDIIAEINRVTSENHIEVVWRDTYIASCVVSDELSFDIEICHMKNTLSEFGLVMKRAKGSSFAYQSVCREISGQWKIRQ